MTLRDSIVDRLFGRTAQGIKYDLDRIHLAAKQLGNPQESFKVIHVAGTNGKGSVCAMVESIIRHHGFKTGLFTSPHLIDFEERFIINGKVISSKEWIELYQKIEPICLKQNLTFFEISTLLAFTLFEHKKVEWAIVETGLGGRLDATNIVDPEVSIVTAISMDHQEYLGDTIEQVALEKLGVVKENTPLVLGKQQNSKIYELAQRVCHERHAPFHCCQFEQKETGPTNTVRFKGRNFSVSLAGTYQKDNAHCALKAAELVGIKMNTQTEQAIKATFIPGRFQIVTIKSKSIVFDTAHNPAAAQHFCASLKKRFPDTPLCFIVGIMKDKKFTEMLLEYAKVAHTIVIAALASKRAAQPQELINCLSTSTTGKVEIGGAIKQSITKAVNDFKGVIAVTGSFITVGEAMQALGVKPFGN